MIPRLIISLLLVAIPAIVGFARQRRNVEEHEANEHNNEDAESRMRQQRRERSMNRIKSWIDNNEPMYRYFGNFDNGLSCPQFFDAVDEVKAIGLRIESKFSPNLDGQISILQLASHSGACLLIELRNDTTIPTNLKDILENEGIIKVGLDVNRFRAFLIRHGIQLKGHFDLRSIYYIEDRATLEDLAETHLNSELLRRNAAWFGQEFGEDKKYDAARRVHMCIRLLLKEAMDGIAQVPDDTTAEQFVSDCIRVIYDN